MLRWVVTVWQAYAHRAASYQTRVLLTLVYLVVLGPAATIGQMFGSRLMDTRASAAQSSWIERPTPEKSLAELRRQF